MTDLKPCPFCGSDATMHANYNHRSEVWFVYVQCDMCGSRGKTHANSRHIDPAMDGFWETNSVYAAAEAWNKRTKEGE